MLRRELGLRDTALFGIAILCGLRWIPSAAHAGAGSLLLWVLTAVFMATPMAIAVATLSAKFPGSGGFYLWTKENFGPWHGFLCFWTYFLGIAFWFPSLALACMSMAVYAVGPHYTHLADNRLFLVAASLAGIWFALGTNLIGMKIGKWTENVGGASVWVTAALLAVLAVVVSARRGAPTNLLVLPKWDWQTMGLWATIAYAMSGLELTAVMGGEIRDPARTIRRAGWIASAFAAVFYISGTASLLALLPPERISEVNGLTQGGQEAAAALGAWWLSPLVAVLLLIGVIGQFGAIGTSTSRLPFVVGVDDMLPAAFGKVHPRWGTPHVAILVFGGLASCLLLAIQMGETARAAYRELVSVMVIAGFIPYLYIFASSWKAGNRLSAVSGSAVTLMAILCAVVPTAEIHNVALFEGKIAASTFGVIGSAWLLYRRGMRKLGAVRS